MSVKRRVKKSLGSVCVFGGKVLEGRVKMKEAWKEVGLQKKRRGRIRIWRRKEDMAHAHT